MLWFKGPKGEDEGVSGREMGMVASNVHHDPINEHCSLAPQ